MNADENQKLPSDLNVFVPVLVEVQEPEANYEACGSSASGVKLNTPKNFNRVATKDDDADSSSTDTVSVDDDFELVHLDDSDEAKDDARIVQLDKTFQEWTRLRKETVIKLYKIADYMEVTTKNSGIAKAFGSGTSAMASCLTIAGGIMTILSAGSALPILVAGTVIGLAGGLTGGGAAVTENIIKSGQMKCVQEALESDINSTRLLKERIKTLSSNRRIVQKIASKVLTSGASATYSTTGLFNLISGRTGSIGALMAGLESTPELFGDDVNKEISKIFLRNGGKVLSGSVIVVVGGVSMVYDIYRLSTEINRLVRLGCEGAEEIRHIAQQLETALEAHLCKEDDEIQLEVSEKEVTIENK